MEEWVFRGELGTRGCTVSTIVTEMAVDLWAVGWGNGFGAGLMRGGWDEIS